MAWYEIVKYRPENYDENGIYQVDEWTSISDIDKSFNGVIFTLEDYLRVEQQYIDSILLIMDKIGCKYLSIQYMEADKASIVESIKSSKYNNIDSNLLDTVHLLKEGKRIYYKHIQNIIRLSLREYIYIVLSNKKKSLIIDFGYDYYLYVSCNLDEAVLNDIATHVGLFINPRS